MAYPKKSLLPYLLFGLVVGLSLVSMILYVTDQITVIESCRPSEGYHAKI